MQWPESHYEDNYVSSAFAHCPCGSAFIRFEPRGNPIRASAAGTLTRSSVALPQSPDLPIASVRSRVIPRDAEYSRRCCCPPTCFLFSVLSLCSVEVDLCGSRRILLYLPPPLQCCLRSDPPLLYPPGCRRLQRQESPRSRGTLAPVARRPRRFAMLTF